MNKTNKIAVPTTDVYETYLSEVFGTKKKKPVKEKVDLKQNNFKKAKRSKEASPERKKELSKIMKKMNKEKASLKLFEKRIREQKAALDVQKNAKLESIQRSKDLLLAAVLNEGTPYPSPKGYPKDNIALLLGHNLIQWVTHKDIKRDDEALTALVAGHFPELIEAPDRLFNQTLYREWINKSPTLTPEEKATRLAVLEAQERDIVKMNAEFDWEKQVVIEEGGGQVNLEELENYKESGKIPKKVQEALDRVEEVTYFHKPDFDVVNEQDHCEHCGGGPKEKGPVEGQPGKYICKRCRHEW